MSIIHALLRWFLDILEPGTGKRRANSRPASPTVPTDLPQAHGSWCPTYTPWLPNHRSPYSHHSPVDGRTTALVRPYLVAHERHCAQQRRRRLALVLAADFSIDLDRHVVGAEGKAA